MIFRLSNFRTPFRHAIRTSLGRTIRGTFWSSRGFGGEPSASVRFTGGIFDGFFGIRQPAPVYIPWFRTNRSMERQNERVRNELEKTKREMERQTENGSANEVTSAQARPLPCLHTFQKSYTVNKPDFNPKTDCKPMFTSSYSSHPPATTKAGGLRGGAARGGKAGRY